VAITYDPATNFIRVTGYTELVPCNFTDIYNADKAGTYSLHARIGIAGVDGAAVVVDNALRPTDEIVLGGASGDLYITITNWNLMTNATIRVTGTDRDGAAQTDDIVVNGNGDFNTAKWFKTVTHTQVTVFNTPGGGSFDYDLTQGQWGVVWRQGGYQFYLEAGIFVGNGVTTTWFQDTLKQVCFSNGVIRANNWGLIYALPHATIKFGELVDAVTRETKFGCSLLSLHTTFGNHRITYTGVNGLVYLYSTNFSGINTLVSGKACQSMATRVWNSHLESTDLVPLPTAETVDVYNAISCNAITAVDTPRGTAWNRFSIVRARSYIGIRDVGAGAVVRNLYGRGATTFGVGIPFPPLVTDHVWLIDADLDLWTFNWAVGSTKFVYRQYSFNLRVVDSDGVGIVGVTVNMDDRFGANVFNVVTDASGDIVEQIITYGYYSQPTGNVLQPAGGGYSPHTVTLSLAGYITRTIVYTMDRQREEIEELLPKGPKKDIEGNLYMEINSVGDLLRL